MFNKNLYLILFLVLLHHFTTQAQLPKWIIGNSQQNSSGSFYTLSTNNLHFFEVDFTGLTPLVTARTQGNSINNIVSMGSQDVVDNAIDDNGNISFYLFCASKTAYNNFTGTVSDTVYFAAFDSTTGKDEVFGKVPAVNRISSVIEHALCPRPSFPGQYYFVYKTRCGSSVADDIRYVIVDETNKTVSSPNTIVSSERSGEGFAVSKFDCTGNRYWLYTSRLETNGYVTIRRTEIASTGLIGTSDIYTIQLTNNSTAPNVNSIEISSPGNTLAICFFSTNSNKAVSIFDLDLSTGILSNERYYTNSAGYSVVTCEFSPDGSRLYLMQGGGSTFPNKVYKCAVISSGSYTFTASDAISSISISASLAMELAYDGKIYINKGLNLNSFYCITNPNAVSPNVISTTSPFLGTTTYRIGSSFPDQIDGRRNNNDQTIYPVIVSSSMSICSGQNVTLNASGGNTYQWSGGSSDSTSTISILLDTTTTFYLLAQYGMCSGLDTITITADTLPICTTSGNINICSGQSTTLTAAGASSYQWSGGSTSTSSSITVSPLDTTIYKVVPINGNCIGNQISDTVFVTQTPVASINVSGDSICSGEAITIIGTGGTNYQWSGGYSANTDTIQDTPLTTTTYYLAVSNGTCIVNDSVTVLVNSMPTATITGNNNICSGQSTTLSANGATSYQWSGGLVSSNASITISPSDTTIYTVTPINGGCYGNAVSDTVKVTATPIASIAASDSAICAGTQLTLIGFGGTSILWSGSYSANTDTIQVSPSSTSIYYLLVSNGQCTNNDSIIIHVDTMPIALISGNLNICSGHSTTLTASGASTYNWNGGNISYSGSSITVSPDTTTTYTLTPLNGLCVGIPLLDTVNVTMSPIAQIESMNDSICDGQTIVLSALEGFSYQWSGGGISASDSAITVAPNQNTIYYLEATNGSCIDFDTLQIIVQQMPVAQLGNNIIGCSQSSIVFNNLSSNATQYEWNFGDGMVSNTNSPTHIYSDSGSYAVTLIASTSLGCSDTTSINSFVTILQTPSAGIIGIANDDNSISITNTANGGTNCIVYFGDGDSLIGCNWDSIIHTFNSYGEFNIIQLVSNGTCVDSAKFTANILEPGISIYVPNCFTPDGNGMNDLFYPILFGINDYKLMIFDRWGELIFQSDENKKAWDGTYKNKPVELGVYVWKVDYTDKVSKQLIGKVTVAR